MRRPQEGDFRLKTCGKGALAMEKSEGGTFQADEKQALKPSVTDPDITEKWHGTMYLRQREQENRRSQGHGGLGSH